MINKSSSFAFYAEPSYNRGNNMATKKLINLKIEQ